MGLKEDRRVHMGVPKLAGKSNWTLWVPRLMEWLQSQHVSSIPILLGESRCPPKAEEGIPEEQRLRKQRRVSHWKANMYRARLQLGNTLDDEPGQQVQEISDAHEAWLKLKELYGEDPSQAADRTWNDFIELRYEKTNRNRAPEFIRRYQYGLWQLRITGIPTPARLQHSNFIRAVGDDKFSDFVNELDLDREATDVIETLYAAFLQFETEKEENGKLDLSLFGTPAPELVLPTSSSGSSKSKSNLLSKDTSDSLSKAEGKKRASSDRSEPGPSGQAKRTRISPDTNHEDRTLSSTETNPVSEETSGSGPAYSPDSPLFVPEENTSNDR